MRLSTVVFLLCLSLLRLAPSSAQAESLTPEVIFAQAAEYTVRIQTRIERALGNDDVGVSEGAGFVVDAEKGWIVTNRHVVGVSPSEVRVAVRQGSYRSASKVYVDPLSDIAVIQAELAAPSAASLGCTDTFGTGHPVGAYGHPWGLEYTGTQGVISGSTSELGPSLLQTDAPINSGNSGGPLISLRSGQVIGISTSSYEEEGAQNMNFAVPIRSVCQILDLLRQAVDPSPPKLPVAFYQFADRRELVVARSYLDGTSLDLQPEDRISAVGATQIPVSDAYELAEALRGTLNDVRIRVLREGKAVDLRGELPPHRLPSAIEFAGMVIGESDFVDSAHLPNGHGLLIHSILPGSAAQAADLQPGWDFLLRVGPERVLSLEDLFRLLQTKAAGTPVTLDFMRLYEPPYLFEYVQREFVAVEPVWLKAAVAVPSEVGGR